MKRNTGNLSHYWGQFLCILAALGYTAIRTKDMGLLVVLKLFFAAVVIVYGAVILPIQILKLIFHSDSSRKKTANYYHFPYRIQGEPEKYLEPYLLMTASLCIPLLVGIYWLYACTAVPFVMCLVVLIKRNRYHRQCGYKCFGPVLLSVGCIVLSLLFRFIFYKWAA